MKLDKSMRRLAMLVSLAGTCACAASPPLGYNTGDRVNWDIPLVAPLDGAKLVVPAMIHGQGPFLFSLEPDSQVSIIDRGVADALQLFTPPDSWVRVRAGNDQYDRRRPYEVMDFVAGDLKIRNVRMYSAKAGSMQYRGMPLAGVLGTDLLSRSIVLDIDRDRGVVHLTLSGHHSEPVQASRIAGRVHKILSIRKVVVPVAIAGARGKAQFDLAVDLGAARTAIWPKHLPGYRTQLALGATQVQGVDLAPFNDRRIEQNDIDGVLGQDVLGRYRVVVDQDKRILWLARRAPDIHALTADRLSRWGDTFARCQTVGCVTIEPGMGDALMLRRDPRAPSQPFDVVLQGLDENGQPLPGLMRARVSEAGPGAAGQLASLPGQAANYRVVDASPVATGQPTQVSSAR